MAKTREIRTNLASLLERSKRVKAAITALQAAAADDALPVDTALLASIRDQHRTVELARARLEATRPPARPGGGVRGSRRRR